MYCISNQNILLCTQNIRGVYFSGFYIICDQLLLKILGEYTSFLTNNDVIYNNIVSLCD